MEKFYFALVFVFVAVLPHLRLHRVLRGLLLVALLMLIFWMCLTLIHFDAESHLTDGGLLIKLLYGAAFNIFLGILYAFSARVAQARKK